MPYPPAVWDQSFQRGNQTGFPLWPPDIQRYRQVASIATKFLQRITGSLTSTNEKWAAPVRAGANRQLWSVSAQFSDTPPSRFLFFAIGSPGPVAARTYPPARAAP